MGYRELRLSSSQVLCIDGVSYDVDWFGMDDGRSERPTDALRFLFQLGHGYMIHLYVIQAGSRGTPGWFFHTTWIKDCAVAEVEMEDTGAPALVEVEKLDLPLCYDVVELADARHSIVTQTFRASGTELEMTFELASGSRLVWTRERRWELVSAQRSRSLEATEWPQFSTTAS
ncbi:MAG: hypothetical protein ACXWUG_28610 [Polyangiales bacterium]